MRLLRSLGAVSSLLLAGSLAWASGEKGEASPADLSGVDLSGEWYVLIHFKDDDSTDKSIVKFRDHAWSIEQTANTITWEEYPFLVFPEEQKLQRRHAMIEHLAWEPNARWWARLRESIEVSSRAMKRKRLTGAAKEGFASLPPLDTGGFKTMTYTENWRVQFEEKRIRIEIIDSLGGVGFEGMEGATVYQITERAASDEFRGRFDRDTWHGTFRMVRAKERKVVK
jgi:hypothetical protein